MINLKVITGNIEKQRKLVLSKLGRLRREDPFATEDRSIIVEPGTDAAVLSGHERTVILEQRLKSDLVEIESALKKIKKGTYGKCERCKKVIDIKRLEVKPQALYCLKCKGEMEKKK
ncbi:MAG: TraR/DksA C4-type zinc finger protein [Patescibacteria group bacterium]